MKYKFTSFYLDNPLVKGRIFDVFEPENITKDIAILFIHGGGWRAGSRTSFHEIMQAFNKLGYLTATADYRLDAKNAFEQLSDIRAAYDGLVSLLKEKELPVKIAVYGESAGAHLASLLICTSPGECGEKNELINEWIPPLMGILQSTPVRFNLWEEMLPSLEKAMRSIAGEGFCDNPEVYERLSLSNYISELNPPIFFMEAELEHMFLSKHTLEIVKKHRNMGIMSHWKVYEGMEHGFFYELRRNAQKKAFEDICDFLEGKLQTPDTLFDNSV